MPMIRFEHSALAVGLLVWGVSCGSGDSQDSTSNAGSGGESSATAGVGNVPDLDVAGGSAGGSPSPTGGSPITAGGTPAALGGALGTCEPTDMSSWTAPPYVPARAATVACTDTLIEQYYADSCQFGGCPAFEEGGQNADCGACLAPSELDASEFGPVLALLVGTLQSSELNGPGCVELKGQLDCAIRTWEYDECTRQACLPTCNPSTSSEYDLYSACRRTARTTSCASYAQAALCLNEETSTACGGQDIWQAIGRVFCAGG